MYHPVRTQLTWTSRNALYTSRRYSGRVEPMRHCSHRSPMRSRVSMPLTNILRPSFHTSLKPKRAALWSTSSSPRLRSMRMRHNCGSCGSQSRGLGQPAVRSAARVLPCRTVTRFVGMSSSLAPSGVSTAPATCTLAGDAPSFRSVTRAVTCLLRKDEITNTSCTATSGRANRVTSWVMPLVHQLFAALSSAGLTERSPTSTSSRFVWPKLTRLVMSISNGPAPPRWSPTLWPLTKSLASHTTCSKRTTTRRPCQSAGTCTSRS